MRNACKHFIFNTPALCFRTNFQELIINQKIKITIFLSPPKFIIHWRRYLRMLFLILMFLMRFYFYFRIKKEALSGYIYFLNADSEIHQLPWCSADRAEKNEKYNLLLCELKKMGAKRIWVVARDGQKVSYLLQKNWAIRQKKNCTIKSDF